MKHNTHILQLILSRNYKNISTETYIVENLDNNLPNFIRKSSSLSLLKLTLRHICLRFITTRLSYVTHFCARLFNFV